MWIPVDTRLHEHPKVQRLAGRLKIPHELVVGLLVRLWGMCSDFDSWTIEGDEAEVSQHYRLPAGFLRELASVGLAKLSENSVTMILTSALSETADRRKAKAAAAANARWHAQTAKHDAQSCSRDAPDAKACSDAIEGKRDRRIKGSRSRASSQPALEGAAEDDVGLPTAAALRAALNGIGAGPPLKSREEFLAEVRALQETA